jgi:hypothetical protein
MYYSSIKLLSNLQIKAFHEELSKFTNHLVENSNIIYFKGRRCEIRIYCTSPTAHGVVNNKKEISIKWSRTSICK